MNRKYRTLLFRLSPVLVAAGMILLGSQSRPTQGEAPRASQSSGQNETLSPDTGPGEPGQTGNGAPPRFPPELLARGGKMEIQTPGVAAIRSVTGLASADRKTLHHLLRTSRDSRELQAAAWALGNKLRLGKKDISVRVSLLERTSPRETRLLMTTLWALSLSGSSSP